ncbi:MAG: anthranilate phosphoribosyltransferase, partial [Gammaproteobacteria bacterium]|nr:anthranilate phosphoribosyltransferase [Gammaproteobacteria bacterium]
LTGKHQAAADIVALNAGAAIYIANLTDELAAGIDRAREIIDSGAALDKLEQLVQFTQAADG